MVMLISSVGPRMPGWRPYNRSNTAAPEMLRGSIPFCFYRLVELEPKDNPAAMVGDVRSE